MIFMITGFPAHELTEASFRVDLVLKFAFFLPSFQQKSYLKEHKLTLHFLKKPSVQLQPLLTLSERLLEM